MKERGIHNIWLYWAFIWCHRAVYSSCLSITKCNHQQEVSLSIPICYELIWVNHDNSSLFLSRFPLQFHRTEDMRFRWFGHLITEVTHWFKRLTSDVQPSKRHGCHLITMQFWHITLTYIKTIHTQILGGSMMYKYRTILDIYTYLYISYIHTIIHVHLCSLQSKCR